MKEDKEESVEKGEKLTNGEIFAAMQAIAKLVEIDFYVADSFKLRKLRQQLSESYKIVEDIRQGLIRKHGQESLKGSGQLEIIGPNDKRGRAMSKNFPKYMAEFNELLIQIAEVKFEKIKLPSEIDGKSIPLSVNDLDRLEKFVEV